MKITCIEKSLKEAINIAERNTSKNKSLPILQSILLSGKSNELIIRATNLETAIEIKIHAKVENSGTFVVSGKILSSFLSYTDNETITIEEKSNNLFIKTKQTHTTIRCFQNNEFPLFPSIESLFSFSLIPEELKESIKCVLPAVSNSDIKPELASIFFNIFKNTAKLAATDSFRLAEKTIISKKLNLNSVVSFMLPYESSVELFKLLDSSNDNNIASLGSCDVVSISGNKNQIIFQGDNIRFISRLTDGNFPDYNQIIPKSFSTETVAKKSDFVSQVKLSGIFAGKLQDIVLDFNQKQKSIIINSSNSDIGENISTIESSVQGEGGKAKFNWRYISDGVNFIQSDYIIFGFNGDQSPLSIKGKGDNSYIYLAMPMRGI